MVRMLFNGPLIRENTVCPQVINEEPVP